MPYIVHTNETIDGVGETADDAWVDMLGVMMHAGIEVRETPGDPDAPGAWTLKSNFHIAPATEALVRQVMAEGGNCGWFRNAAGVCCTRAEHEREG